jgi:tetratricopeptide (TPR) repeat protein
MENDIEEAVKFSNEQEKHDSINKIRAIYSGARNVQTKLQAGLGLIANLNVADHYKELSRVCEECLAYAEYINDYGSKAYILGQKALLLRAINSEYLYHKKNLTLAPEWTGFSLVSDKDSYEELDKKIKDNENESDSLFQEALTIAREHKEKKAEAGLLMLMGNVEGMRCLNFKLENLRAPKLFLLTRRYLNIEKYTCFNRAERRKLEQMIKRCENYFREAITIYMEIDDEDDAAYVYYNMANELRTLNCFVKAKRSLKKAKEIAIKKDIKQLLYSAELMEKSINNKNRDIPDHIGNGNTIIKND